MPGRSGAGSNPREISGRGVSLSFALGVAFCLSRYRRVCPIHPARFVRLNHRLLEFRPNDFAFYRAVITRGITATASGRFVQIMIALCVISLPKFVAVFPRRRMHVVSSDRGNDSK